MSGCCSASVAMPTNRSGFLATAAAIRSFCTAIEIAGELALRRIAPGVDIDRLDIDPLLVHVLQARRSARAERDRSGEIAFDRRGKRRVFDHLPDFRDKRMRVNVDDRDRAAANRDAAPRRGRLRSVCGVHGSSSAEQHASRRAATFLRKALRLGIVVLLNLERLRDRGVRRSSSQCFLCELSVLFALIVASLAVTQISKRQSRYAVICGISVP